MLETGATITLQHLGAVSQGGAFIDLDDERHYDLAPGQGILIGMALGIPVWVALIVIIL